MKLYTQIKKLFRKFDVSPFDSGGLYKTLIFIVWGINALVFLGNSLVAERDDYVQRGNCTIVCTLTKKIAKTDLYIENFDLVNTTSFIIVSSYDYEVQPYDVLLIIHDRSPPSKILHTA